MLHTEFRFSRPVEVPFDEDLAEAGLITPFAAKCPTCRVKTNAYSEQEAREQANVHNLHRHGIPVPA